MSWVEVERAEVEIEKERKLHILEILVRRGKGTCSLNKINIKAKDKKEIVSIPKDPVAK